MLAIICMCIFASDSAKLFAGGIGAAMWAKAQMADKLVSALWLLRIRCKCANNNLVSERARVQHPTNLDERIRMGCVRQSEIESAEKGQCRRIE